MPSSHSSQSAGSGPFEISWCFNHRKPCSSSPFGVTGFHFAVVLVVEKPAKQSQVQLIQHIHMQAKSIVKLEFCSEVPASVLLLEGSGG